MHQPPVLSPVDHLLHGPQQGVVAHHVAYLDEDAPFFGGPRQFFQPLLSVGKRLLHEHGKPLFHAGQCLLQVQGRWGADDGRGGVVAQRILQARDDGQALPVDRTEGKLAGTQDQCLLRGQGTQVANVPLTDGPRPDDEDGRLSFLRQSVRFLPVG